VRPDKLADAGLAEPRVQIDETVGLGGTDMFIYNSLELVTRPARFEATEEKGGGKAILTVCDR